MQFSFEWTNVDSYNSKINLCIKCANMCRILHLHKVLGNKKIILSCSAETYTLLHLSYSLYPSLHLSLSPPTWPRALYSWPAPFLSLNLFCTLFFYATTLMSLLLLSPSPSLRHITGISGGCLFFFLSTCSHVHSFTLSPLSSSLQGSAVSPPPLPSCFLTSFVRSWSPNSSSCPVVPVLPLSSGT